MTGWINNSYRENLFSNIDMSNMYARIIACARRMEAD
jgi:hypothetical protein